MDPESTTEDHKDPKLEMALQLLAVLLNRAGGETVISQEEFDSFEGVQVQARHLGRDHLKIQLEEECDGCDICGGPTS